MPTPAPCPLSSCPVSFSIPDDELVFKATRSGGAGGQHVNTSSTRIEVSWCPGQSRVLSEAQRQRVATALATRLDSEGWLRIVSSETRSQVQNRERAVARLHELMRRALVVPKARRATKPSRAAKQARLDDKRASAKRKAERRRRDWD
ncbi:MAG: aminoacyl-tRNA hydrolase [Gemmatimonadetes bacterium]|nr:aminoacyl-tRNA hydrolase [Gemmatimonadota bacterium]